MLLIVGIQMYFPLISGDALAHERIDVVANVGKKNIKAANSPLCEMYEISGLMVQVLDHTEVKYQIGTLFVRNLKMRPVKTPFLTT